MQSVIVPISLYLFIGVLVGYAIFDTQMRTGRYVFNPRMVFVNLLITSIIWPFIIMVLLFKK